jgi:hypothetical protein
MTLRTFTSGEVLTAADTNAYLASAGLVYVAQTNVGTAVSAIDILGCFTSAYDNYVVSVSNVGISAGGVAWYLTLLNGTSPSTSQFFGNTFYVVISAGGGLTNANYVNQANAEVGSGTSTAKNGFTFEVNQPNLATKTYTSYNSCDDNYYRFGVSQQASTTQWTGLRLSAGGATHTGGIVTVYGRQKA